MPKNQTIAEKLSVLPYAPGVYLMKNAAGSIIYVGKSKCLKNRVSSYFQAPEHLNVKTRKLVSNIVDFETIVTGSEAEALLLENELIKRHMPKYNIKLKDSKSYPYIKLTSESFPHLVTEYERRDDRAKYFGPYTSAASARDIITTVQKLFRLPTCERKLCYGKAVGRPCLNYHIDRCMAPCMGKISESDYASVLADVELLLKGDLAAVKKSLEQKMYDASEKMLFEAAAKYRDNIQNLERLSIRQKIKSTPGTEKDVFGFFEAETHSALAILMIRDGVVIDKHVIFMGADEISDTEALVDLILRYYHDPALVPRELALSFSLDSDSMYEATAAVLAINSRHPVKVYTPQRGKNKELCLMAVRNAEEAIRTKVRQEDNDSSLLIRLAQTFELDVVPERIESYDISNSGNTDIYCGMIVVENAHFKKSDYRAFSIRTTDGADDYASMTEALTRRFKHLKDPEDHTSLSVMPDLILLDGGVGQVSVVKKAAEECGVCVPIFGMVKDDYHKTRTLTDGTHEISIAKDALLFNFIYKIQEEVHRFTFSKMDASRRKRMKKTELTNVKGVGEAKAKALYDAFQSLEALKNASRDDLQSVKGITPEIADNLYLYLHSDEQTASDAQTRKE